MSQQDNTDMSQYFYRASAADFMKIPGSPVAYWMPAPIVESFIKCNKVGDIAPVKKGLITSDNNRFLRAWYEVDYDNVFLTCLSREESSISRARWYPINSGGEYRKWYGNNETLINWQFDGKDIIAYNSLLYGSASRQIQNTKYYFKKCLTWSNVTSGDFGVRLSGEGYIFGCAGTVALPDNENYYLVAGFLNSNIASFILKLLNPTLNFVVANITSLPLTSLENSDLIGAYSKRLEEISKEDWDNYEISWDFSSSPLLKASTGGIQTLRDVYQKYVDNSKVLIDEYKRLECEINRIFLKAYELSESNLTPYTDRKITLKINPYYRYSTSLVDAAVLSRYQSDIVVELTSYSIGCMMGRYSLDKLGLILASQGENLEDYLGQIPSPRFFPDEDAILPITDEEWFPDDATNRFREFVRVVWGDDLLDENLTFVAESLCLYAIKPKKGESSLETIRRYLSTQFYKDHMRTYKKRPIYWLFSSGKHKAFECLVYLHRYNEGTLSRMRMEYVVPLQSRYQARIEDLDNSLAGDVTTSDRKRLQKEQDQLRKKLDELRRFDEQLRHYADQRIQLDLDDGVKVNYGKFGDLLAEVKAITGK